MASPDVVEEQGRAVGGDVERECRCPGSAGRSSPRLIDSRGMNSRVMRSTFRLVVASPRSHRFRLGNLQFGAAAELPVGAALRRAGLVARDRARRRTSACVRVSRVEELAGHVVLRVGGVDALDLSTFSRRVDPRVGGHRTDQHLPFEPIGAPVSLSLSRGRPAPAALMRPPSSILTVTFDCVLKPHTHPAKAAGRGLRGRLADEGSVPDPDRCWS